MRFVAEALYTEDFPESPGTVLAIHDDDELTIGTLWVLIRESGAVPAVFNQRPNACVMTNSHTLMDQSRSIL